MPSLVSSITGSFSNNLTYQGYRDAEMHTFNAERSDLLVQVHSAVFICNLESMFPSEDVIVQHIHAESNTIMIERMALFYNTTPPGSSQRRSPGSAHSLRPPTDRVHHWHLETVARLLLRDHPH